MGKKVKKTDLMTGFEVRQYRGYKKSAGDLAKQKEMFKNAVKERLAMEERVVLPTGEVANIPAVELLVDAKFQFDLDNPQGIDLVKWLKAAGEDVNATEVTLKGADELFGDIVIRKD